MDDRPPPGVDDRLIRSPIFLFSPMRSGSTLLRVILNSHSQLMAPHELHLNSVRVRFPGKGTKAAMDQLGWTTADLENMLWDRTLAAILAQTGKASIVSKTPSDVRHWQRISTYWPEARYIFLLRHPASIVQSWSDSNPDLTVEESIARVRPQMDALVEARAALPGPTVRYEELVRDPDGTVRALCEALAIPFEPEMLNYGNNDHGPFRAKLGDWKKKIASGRIQSARALPDPAAVPEGISDLVHAWEYDQ